MFPCCCTPLVVPPETTNTHHYSILVHISHIKTMAIIYISLFLTYISHYYALTFQLISSPVDIINSILITINIFFLRSRHTLWRARKQILPLLSLIFSILSSWLNLQTGVATWLLLRFLFVSRVLALQIRQGQTRWKDNTPG